MSSEKGDEEYQGYHDEERQASHSGRMPHMQHQDVQNREGLAETPV
jgi:hypothetical protein